ncbi:single-stranded DNA-binding protein, mitochondrial-like [Ctenocephalides felis]|uniref:single-stranded DNA-binding protein, mitochondrial-like n=1 Tax=Ctenocephalides felis TaxID=7515 RepID=UPI000E6E54C4|nr:single-stranded DNA-binding protein, mitochondrial-like [Ctenocephalides felis]XP_026479007.1 single-stranded DNA-binding protein, mitochondrial-like [Ctenocephalides felis]
MFSLKLANVVKNAKIQNSFKILSCSASNNEPTRIEKSINNVTLLGRVGAEPQKRGSEEHPVVTFSVATHSNYKYESGELLQKTDWHRVCVFRPSLRESVYNHLKKGQRVHVTGRISYSEINGEDGKPRHTTSIIADDVIFFQMH